MQGLEFAFDFDFGDTKAGAVGRCEPELAHVVYDLLLQGAECSSLVGAVIVPNDETTIHAKDRIVILSQANMVKKVEAVFAVRFEFF